jgi:hypothetical protein
MVRYPPRHDRYSALLLHRLLSGVDIEYRSLAPCRSGGNRSCPEPLHGGLRAADKRYLAHSVIDWEDAPPFFWDAYYFLWPPSVAR